MTDTLTNEEICELLGWKKEYDRDIELEYWSLPDSPNGSGTPDFDKLEQPWFDYVVPWLNGKELDVEIRVHKGIATVIIDNYVNPGNESEPLIEAQYPKLRIAFNKALYQLREQL